MKIFRQQKLSHKHKRRGLNSALRAIALWKGFAIAALLLPPFTRPAHTAERIIFSVGPFERSISVGSVEAYIEEGIVTEEMAPFLGLIDPDMQVQVRDLLSQRLDVDVTTVAQVVYSPQGQFLLGRAGEVFRTGARISGQQGLSGAAVVSAADTEEGLTALNVLRRFPTPVLRIDIKEGEAITRKASRAFEQGNLALSLVDELSFETASAPFPEGTSAAELNSLVTRLGSYKVKRTTLKLRVLGPSLDIYVPEAPDILRAGFSNAIIPNGFAPEGFTQSGKHPVVVISHGVGSSRLSYAYLAQFLAEHGYAVVSLEHPGSNEDQIGNFVEGVTGNVVPDDEFIDRPQLVSQVLTDLEVRSQTSSTLGKSLANIDFNNVGIVGQSFGGYTALAVAGAPLNLASLQSTCPPDFTIDISLLLQCQAAALGETGQQSISFKDPRIKAVFAINPMTDAVFGEDSLSQIDVPVFMMASSADTIAPALPEQIRPFTWLTAPEKYLLVLEGATHFSTIGPTGNETFDLPPEIIGPVPEVAQRYTQSMSLAFLNVYLKGDSRYQPALTSAFTTRFSEPEMPLSILSDLSGSQLKAQLRASVESDQQLQQAVETAIETVVERETSRLRGTEAIAYEEAAPTTTLSPRLGEAATTLSPEGASFGD